MIMSLKKISCAFILGFTILSVNSFIARSQAIWYNREEINDDALTNTLTVSYDHSSFLYGRNGAYAQSKALTISFDSSPFSDVGLGSVLSGYGSLGIIDPNNFTEDIKPINDLPGVNFSNGGMMSMEGGLHLGSQLGNRSRTFFIIPHLNIGFSYNTKNSITPLIDDKFALKSGVGLNLMVTGRYLSTYFLKNCFLLMRNDFATDTRGTLTKTNRVVTDPSKRWVYSNSLAIGVSF